MTKEEVELELEEIKLPLLVCGMNIKDKSGINANFMTQHYIVGEYFCIYENNNCVFQGGFKDQKAMDKKLRLTIKKMLKNDIEIINIRTREIIKD